jgi:replicative DNA helicase
VGKPWGTRSGSDRTVPPGVESGKPSSQAPPVIERISPSPIPAALLERVPPHSEDAETALLGSLLMDVGNEAMGSVVPIVRPDDFYKTAHRKIYEAFLALYERGEPLDPVLALSECERRGILAEIGGHEYLARLASAVVGPTNAEHYARIVREKAIARGVIRVASDLQRAAYDDEAGGEALLEMAEHRVFELSRSQDDGQATSVHLLIEKAFQELDKRDGAPSGLRTHFFQFDDLTAGLHPGELMIVAGRPSMGKTTFALNVAYNVAVLEKVPTVVFSLEMSRQQIAKNILCSHAEVEAHKLRGGRFLSDADYRRLSEAGGPLYDAPLFIDDTPALTTTVLRAKARRLKSKQDIGLIVVDYLQLMEAMGASKNVESRQQEISYISRSLKGLARELNVPVMALSQLNRQADAREDHRPRLSDLRESGAVEQDADVVCFLFRKHYYTKAPSDRGLAELIVAKQRNGPTDTVQLAFQDQFMRFDNFAPGARAP